MTEKKSHTDDEAKSLRKQLEQAGISRQAIDAAWPNWWSAEAANSLSARAELRFSLARRLGLSPKSLVGERVEFVWRDGAKFKNSTIGNESEAQKAALISFCKSVGRLLLRATPLGGSTTIPAGDLRKIILAKCPHVDLGSLLGLCWVMGIPVIHLRVFPLQGKFMQAIVVKDEGRFAILLAKDSQYPAPVAFSLAHEIGHIQLGHVEDSVFFDQDVSAESTDKDDEEKEADFFALELTTGDGHLRIESNIKSYNGFQLAHAARAVHLARRIEPGILALCLAYQTGNWAPAMAAMRHIYSEKKDVWREVNKVAQSQLELTNLSEDDADFLNIVMGEPNE